MQTISRKLPLTTLSARAGECHLSVDAAFCASSRDVGASVVLTVYAPSLVLGGLLRFAYPDSAGNPKLAEANPYLFADTGIPAFLSCVRELGVADRDLRLYAVGAADAPEFGQTGGSGRANELALKKVLWRENVWLAGEDLGGDMARSVWFQPAMGRLIVRSQKRRLPETVRELRYAI